MNDDVALMRDAVGGMTLTPDGLCLCGCGQPTASARQTDRRYGWIAGEPRRFVRGHHRRRCGPEYIVDDATGCWMWQGCRTPQGYPLVQPPGDNVRRAHRVYYERHVGPIPAGLELDHLCRNRACVNPAHLEPVTHAENIRRGHEARRQEAIANDC